MLADDDDEACPNAEAANNADNANTAERISIAGFPFGTRNSPYLFKARILQCGTRLDRGWGLLLLCRYGDLHMPFTNELGNHDGCPRGLGIFEVRLIHSVHAIEQSAIGEIHLHAHNIR